LSSYPTPVTDQAAAYDRTMATILIVDTCGTFGGIAVAAWADTKASEDGSLPGLRVLAERVLPGRETQERLMTALAEVLREASLQPADLDVLAVVAGPGSFTGVRIGMAAVKGLAEALGKPVVAVSRLAVLAAQGDCAGSVHAWIDAGRGDVFAGHYRDGVCLSEAMLHGPEALLGVHASDIVVVMEEGLPEPPYGALRVPAVGVHEALPLAVAKAQAKQFADTALLDANYLRVPDAELARLAKLLAAASEAATAR
jgi:tRNA threonylcarbamoyladenosine biosynthesis protein TsaB